MKTSSPKRNSLTWIRSPKHAPPKKAIMRIYLFYSLKLIGYTLVLAGIIFLLNTYLAPQWIHEKIGTVLRFYFILTLLTGLLTQYLLKISKENSVPILLGSSLIRLLASLGFVFVILWSSTENILWFVVDIFIIYLLYLLFDIYTLITDLQPHSE